MLTLPGIPSEVHEWCATETVRLRGGDRWRFRNTLIQDEGALREFHTEMMRHKDLSYDTETSGLNPSLGARIIGHATTVKTGDRELTNWYIPIRHVLTDEAQLSPELVAEVYRDILGRREINIRGHHLKFDALMARADGILLLGTWNDTSIKAIINNENEPRFGLKELSEKYLFHGAKDEESSLTDWMRLDARGLKLAFKKRKKNKPDEPTYLERFGYSRTPIQMCGLYACHDTALTHLLDDFYTPLVLPQFQDVYLRDVSVSKELFEMEWWGLPVNVEEIRRATTLLEQEVDYWSRVVYHYAGAEFDITDENLRTLFFERCGMEVQKYTEDKKNPQPSVDKESRALLSKLYPNYAPLIDAVDKRAKLQKLASTYAHSWMKYVTPEGRVHSKYNQLEQRDEHGIPVTGRLSSTDPNTQNVAKKPIHLTSCQCKKCKKGSDGPEVTISIRRYYTIPAGWVRAFIDLSQIELRVLAWFSQDPMLLYCYANDMDVHAITADRVTDGDRDAAKRVNFGNNYGQGKFGLAKQMPYYAEDRERAIEDAGKFLERFFQLYAGIPIFRKNLAAEMRRNGDMFINPFGRPRRIETISSEDQAEYARALRMMMSSIISGTAADMLKEIMLRTRKVLDAEYGHLPYEQRGRMVQSIHDENAYDLPIQGCGLVLPKLMKCFTDWPQFEAKGVPIRASCELSVTTWEDKRAIEFLPGGSFKWAA